MLAEGLGRRLWTLAWLVGFAAVLLGARARAQVGPVTPADISTPTPTLHPAFVPTATPVAIANGETRASTYRVRAGDTLLTVALETGLDVADAYCMIAPDFTSATPLVIDNVLTLPPPDTRCYPIEAGDTLASVAAAHGVTTGAIRNEPWNAPALPATPTEPLPAGWHLRIPSPAGRAESLADAQQSLPLLLRQSVDSDPARALAVAAAFPAREAVGGATTANYAPVPADWPYGSGEFSWPIYGWLTQDFHAHHRAIDVAAPVGTFVTAADRGVVIRAGWNDQGYGSFVIVDHNIDYITLYAHLSEILVEEGDVVAQGEILGRVGSTGNSTGPHLHFEIRDFGRRIDPVPILLDERFGILK